MESPAERHDMSRPTTLTSEEGHELFDYAARETAGMSGPEFLARYDAGEIDEPGDETSEDWALRRLIMLIPFGR